MYTEPKIITTSDLTKRAYITFYFDSLRYREYNGNRLNLSIFPNHAKTIKDRDKLLSNLQFQFRKALDTGWTPLANIEVDKRNLNEVMLEILNDKLGMDYSRTYKRDLKSLHDQFISFFFHNKSAKPKDITIHQIESFLMQYNSSPRNYMNKRRTLSVFFSEMVRTNILATNPVMLTRPQKSTSHLHEIYSDEGVRQLLTWLDANYPLLGLCCLITYGCLLRPHEEIRLLNIGHFSNDFQKITLAGNENKSGRIRTVNVPTYVSTVIKRRLSGVIDKQTNIFTLQQKPFNHDYFKTQWSRAKVKMSKAAIISPNQTIYSFRHTAAVQVFRKTKDLHILQQLLGHSDMIVTLKYLRGLGVSTNEELKHVMPELKLP